MTTTPLYTYRLSGRRPIVFLGLGVGIIMLATGISQAVPWYFMAPVGIALAMLAVMIITNPQTGSELTAESLTYFNRSLRKTVRIKDVTHMKVRRWSDGPDTVALTLKSGDVVHVPSMSADSKLAVALREMGVGENLG